MRVLVTGANGYVGRAVLRDLADAGHAAIPAVRSAGRVPEPWHQAAVEIGEIGPETRWNEALSGIEAVIHLAAPAVLPGDPNGDAQRVIVRGTERLVRAAAEAGIRRLVFMSSVKAMGEATPPEGVAEDAPADPRDAYGKAKLEAESIAAGAPFETVVLRSPAVYGRASGGNVRQMIDFLRTAPPVLPLGYGGNRRSFIHRDNLSGATIACLDHPKAAGRVFVATDGPAESTAALTRRILRALGRRAAVLPMPGMALRALCAARWGQEAARRLVDSYAFDDGALRRTLDWTPALDPDAAMADAVAPGPDPLLQGTVSQ